VIVETDGVVINQVANVGDLLASVVPLDLLAEAKVVPVVRISGAVYD